MATSASPDSIAGQARRLYTEELVKGLTGLVQSVIDGARALLDKPSEHMVFQRRRDLVQGLMQGAQGWHRGMVVGLRKVLQHGVSASGPGDLPPPGSGRDALTLVPDDTIELEIVTSRLALAVMDRASWEFADLRSRVAHLEGRTELDPHDMLRAHVLSRITFDAWRAAGLNLEGWREMQPILHDEIAVLVEEAYHETNRWLMEQKVLPEVDLRPFIRRSRTHPNAHMGWSGPGSSFAGDGASSAAMGLGARSEYPSSAGFAGPGRGGG
ncbi:MAG: DUF1631 family protein, partial [Rubrivivax sp.]|nr:DUF1631 family protein [Rubrivivax sp.]